MNTIETKSPAKKLQLKAYQNFGNLPENSRALLFSNAESILSGNIKKSSGDMELEEAYVSIEGLVNHNLDADLDFFTQTDVISSLHELSYYVNEGRKFVDNEEFAAVYQEVYNELHSQLQLNPDEDVLLVDMEISDLDTINEFVTFTATAVLARRVNIGDVIWYYPDDAYYAVGGAGICDGTPNYNWTNGVDAASIINGYLNTAPWKLCPNGINYPVPIEVLYTYNSGLNTNFLKVDISPNVNTWNDVISHYWKSNSIDCLGYTHQEWQDLYADAAYLKNYGETRVQTHLNPNAEFWKATYHGHNNFAPGGDNPDISEQYYHGGGFYYAIITCAP